jgi:glucose dehydrogenase
VLSMEYCMAGSRPLIRPPATFLYQFHGPTGIIENPIAYMHDGKQYVVILTGVGGWAAIGLAEGAKEARAS